MAAGAALLVLVPRLQPQRPNTDLECTTIAREGGRRHGPRRGMTSGATIDEKHMQPDRPVLIRYNDPQASTVNRRKVILLCRLVKVLYLGHWKLEPEGREKKERREGRREEEGFSMSRCAQLNKTKTTI